MIVSSFTDCYWLCMQLKVVVVTVDDQPTLVSVAGQQIEVTL